jgi:hypothetical protein
MPRQHQLDFRASQGFDDVEIFFARESKNALDAFIFQRGNQKVRSLGTHWSHLPALREPSRDKSGKTMLRGLFRKMTTLRSFL